jgi:hypothetical protein
MGKAMNGKKILINKILDITNPPDAVRPKLTAALKRRSMKQLQRELTHWEYVAVSKQVKHI